MQNITESEFQREVEALKSHRRFSVNRPIHDPDLPEIAAAHQVSQECNPSHLSANTTGTPPSFSSSRDWTTTDAGVMLRDDGPSSLTGSLTKRSNSNPRSLFTARRRGAAASTNDDVEISDRNGQSGTISRSENASLTEPLDPGHLFWVPASMHPEISPSDFRKFLHDHASRAVREQQESGKIPFNEQKNGSNDQRTSYTSDTPLHTSQVSSVEALKKRSTSIARRGSTLRRQYRPEMEDENDALSSSNENRTRRTFTQRQNHQPNVPELSLDDLQRLEQLAEEASKSSDPSELRSVLRRTMSLNVAPSALDQVDAVPSENEQDSPLIVPRPGQILRRAARTKIRKSSFSNDGANIGSRRRRGPGSQSIQEMASDRDTNTNAGMTGEDSRRESEISEPSDESVTSPFKSRSDGITDSIVDVYSRDSFLSDDSQRTSLTSLAESAGSEQASNELSSSPMDLNSHDRVLVDDPTTPTQAHMTDAFARLKTDTIKSDYFDDSKYLNDARRTQVQNLPHASGPSSEADESVTSMIERPAIKPIAVQHVPPVPAFEKTRSAPLPSSSTSIAQHQKSKEQINEPGESRQMGHLPANSQLSLSNAHHQTPLQQKLVKSDTMPILGSMQSAPSASKPAKEKKSSFGLHWLSNWTKDDNNEKLSKKEKKGRKERERESHEPGFAPYSGQQALSSSNNHERDSSASSSFLGSLFGRKKGHEESNKTDYGSHLYSAATGMHNPSTGSLLDMFGKPMTEQGHYARYPIHIERAVYRLSHIKLANPRRPLYEQVLISNLMFWYLSVINRTQQQQQQEQQQTQTQRQTQSGSAQAEQQAGDQEYQMSFAENENLAPVSEDNNARWKSEEARLDLDSSMPDKSIEAQSFQHDQTQSDHLKRERELQDSSATSLALDLHPGFGSLNIEEDEGKQNATGRTNNLVKDLFGYSKPFNGGHQEGAVQFEGEHDLNNSSYPNPSSNSNSISGSSKGGLIGAKGRAGGSANVVVNPQRVTSIPSTNSNSNSKTKRGGLVKPNRAPPGTRSAERAIPAAAYGAQHRQISSEMLVAGVSNKDISGAQSSSTNRIPNTDRLGPASASLRASGVGRSVSAGHSNVRDNESAWIGSSSSGNGEVTLPASEIESRAQDHHLEDRKSDPMSDYSHRQMQYSAEPETLGGKKLMSNRLSEPVRGDERYTSISDLNQQDREAHSPSRSNQSSIEQSVDQDILLSNGVATGREASAMLDAARLSQSRRR